MVLSSSPILKLNASGGADAAPLLRVWHPQLGPPKGENLVVDWDLWVADHRLGFPSLSSVVADPHFVRRIEQLVVPKSESMHSCGVCALCVW